MGRYNNTQGVDPSRVLKIGDTMTGVLVLPTDGLVVGTTELVTSNGNVGIGTASPGGNLEVGTVDTLIKPAIRLRQASSPSYGFDVDVEEVISGYLSFYSVANDVRTLGLTQTRASGKSGNVGIGTASPGGKLTIQQSVDDWNYGLRINNTGVTKDWQFLISGGDLIIGEGNGSTSGTASLWCKTGGAVGICQLPTSTVAKLEVVLSGVPAAADNAAAATAGVAVGGFYRTNADPSVLCIRSA